MSGADDRPITEMFYAMFRSAWIDYQLALNDEYPEQAISDDELEQMWPKRLYAQDLRTATAGDARERGPE